MSLNFKIQDLKESFSLKDLTNTFLESFEDYIVKIHLTEELLDHKIKGELISLKHSIGSYRIEDERLVGFILHAIDNEEKPSKLYNAGTGVIKSARGNKLVEEMYKKMIPIYKENGINSIILEVIEGNDRAIKVYERCHFKTIRSFNTYKGELIVDSLKQYIDNSIYDRYKFTQVQKEITGDIKQFLNKYQECIPSWSNTIECIEREFNNQNFNRCWIATLIDTNEIVGFVSIAQKRIRQILVHPNFRNENIATTLIYQMLIDINDPNNNIYNIINVEPKNQNLVNFLVKRLNLTHLISQREMELKL